MREVRSGEYKMWSGECEVRSMEYGVENVKCGV